MNTPKSHPTPAPELPPGWRWRPRNDGTGYLDAPSGHTTRGPVTPERAERLSQIWSRILEGDFGCE